MDEFWSSSDFAYMCLRDRRRTDALRRAIQQVVRPGDTVLDVGTGTGVLALFAAGAGAGRVLAVEADPVLAGMVEHTVAANGFADRITVLAADVRRAELPPVDVVVAELIETALIEETLVPVLNSLYRRGVITARTRVIPAGYRTRVRLVSIDLNAYGLVFPVFRHEWSFFAASQDPADPDWLPVAIEDRSAPAEVWAGRLDSGPVQELVQARVRLRAGPPARVNGVRILGEAVLADGLTLGACPTLNGDKVLPLPDRSVAGVVELAVGYRMGGGLGELNVQWI